MSPVRLPVRLMIGGAVLLGGAIAAPLAVQAQTKPVPVVSQPVVQSVPGGESMKLNDALNRLAKDPRDIAALLDAGKASLDLGDVDAAIGFFQRAATLSPGNAQAKAGLAGAYVLKRDPYTAIPLFSEAEKDGPIDPARLADRGLAYDLVGDNQTAQRYYRESLAVAPSDETVRRLALSMAIGGDRRGMETTLAPLLQKQDKAAWRTRAFGLAILGYADEAEGIARQSLPADRATAISAYLRFMPRLTPSQQAAAGNLGHFPRAAEVGVDDPRVAQYARPRPALASAASVAPASQPVKTKGKSKGRATEKTAPTQAKAQPQAAPPVAPPEPKVGREVNGEPVELAAIDEPAKQPNAQTQLAAVTTQPVVQAAQKPATPPPAQQAAAPGFASIDPVNTNPAPGFDLKQVSASNSQVAAPQTATSQTQTAPPPAPRSDAAPQSKPERFEDVFAEFSKPSVEAAPAAGAVDVRKLPPPAKEVAVNDSKDPKAKESAKDAKGKPVAKDAKLDPCAEPPSKAKTGAKGKTASKAGAKAAKASDTQCKNGKQVKAPSHPSRIWVQVATGKNKKALAFDWNRFAKDDPAVFKGRTGYTSAWGQTNRLLTGPFDSEAAANAYIAKLKKAGHTGAFIWTSPAGQVVDALP
ncbi:SPOR domain-containing protein [Novosphingobium sp.]|uniref:SPOR domain-containing protein n=1 Tax=Novosphingobium sp. TaxID=1874826 RepID=UPI0035B0311C